MGRPPLSVGQHGNISFRRLDARKVRAMAYVRDADGRRREVTALGTSQGNARSNLLTKLNDRAAIGEHLDGDSRLRDVAAAWAADIDRQVTEGQLAPNTARIYHSVLDNHVMTAVGELRVREATVPRLAGFVRTFRDHHQAALTKSARTVLNGLMGYAVRNGALSANPMRDVGRVGGGRKRPARGLSQVERDQWLAAMEADIVAVRHDLPDLTRMMLATGVRIGEMLAATFADVDRDDKTIAIDWNIVRVTGRGLLRMQTKSAAGERTLRLPGWAVDVLIRRGDQFGWTGPVFPAITSGRRAVVERRGGSWRDPSNTSRSLREARDRAGFEWVTSHVFRKTVATVLDESGLTAREIADQLGHAKVSMTQDVYMGRKAGGDGASVALEDLFGNDSAE